MSVMNLRGWLDYDRDKLPALTPDERIDYFEKRVRFVVINPLRRAICSSLTTQAATPWLHGRSRRSRSFDRFPLIDSRCGGWHAGHHHLDTKAPVRTHAEDL